jgi:hypothetical protein
MAAKFEISKDHAGKFHFHLNRRRPTAAKLVVMAAVGGLVRSRVTASWRCSTALSEASAVR